MDTAWILVAHRSGAQLFEKRGRELSLLQDIPHGEGRPADQQPDTDKPSRRFVTGPTGHQPAGKETRQAKEKEAMRFIRELAGMLEEGRVHNRYNKIVLVAESRFLGEMRAALSPETGALISATQAKDLAWMDTQAIKEYLQDITWPPPGAPRYSS
jgi:protein required for attachment to host cells